jgi:quinol-cytochrome oxidoreductase complex cytochrome b subunit
LEGHVFLGFHPSGDRRVRVYFGPFGPSGQPDPTIIQTAPRPDYFFLWLYAVLSLLPPSMETPALLIGPVIALGVLWRLPFFSGEGEKSWKRGPSRFLRFCWSRSRSARSRIWRAMRRGVR